MSIDDDHSTVPSSQGSIQVTMYSIQDCMKSTETIEFLDLRTGKRSEHETLHNTRQCSHECHYLARTSPGDRNPPNRKSRFPTCRISWLQPAGFPPRAGIRITDTESSQDTLYGSPSSGGITLRFPRQIVKILRFPPIHVFSLGDRVFAGRGECFAPFSLAGERASHHFHGFS